MKITTYIIDAFTAIPCKGNPTAVCILTEVLEDVVMLGIAKELDYPVTAFYQSDPVDGIYMIRYFTITGEIPACGHATLAAARVVFERTSTTDCQFKTIKNVLLEVVQKEEIIYVTYPIYEANKTTVTHPMLQSLGLSDYEESFFCAELQTLFITVKEPSVLRNLSPNYQKLLASNDEIKEVVITSISDDSNYDFLLRSFCPWIGIDEDPVTGLVHSFLAGYWKAKLNKANLIAYQASERGGEVYLIPIGSSVAIGGKTYNHYTEE